MKPFLDADFLLDTPTAQRLYHDEAEVLPIVDYHSHIQQGEIAQRKTWRNVTELWLGADHYKWRLMRAAGIPENLITGDAEDRKKFIAFCGVLPLAIGNPIHHWSHLELRRLFGIETLIDERNAPRLWDEANAKLAGMDSWTFLEQAKVEIACTTDDPADDLAQHTEIARSTLKTRVLPAFRPDAAMRVNAPGFPDYLKRLGTAASLDIHSFADLIRALERRITFFHEHGARISDHGVEVALPRRDVSDSEAETLFTRRMAGTSLNEEQAELYQFAILSRLGRLYAARNWTMCLHIGPQRNNSSRMFKKIGPDAGFDSISDMRFSASLAYFLNSLDQDDLLPKTMLFCLNPTMNEIVSTMAGNFQEGPVAGKVQFGPAWWFNDHKDGNLQQFRTLANHGLLGTFVGMVTDSRSFASYPRHEYFRRLLCRQIGHWVEDGEYPNDTESLRRLVHGICYGNAMTYFGW